MPPSGQLHALETEHCMQTYSQGSPDAPVKHDTLCEDIESQQIETGVLGCIVVVDSFELNPTPSGNG